MEIIYLGVRDKARRAHGSLDFDSTRILFPIPIELGGMLFLDLPLVSPYLRDRERVSLREREGRDCRSVGRAPFGEGRMGERCEVGEVKSLDPDSSVVSVGSDDK